VAIATRSVEGGGADFASGSTGSALRHMAVRGVRVRTHQDSSRPLDTGGEVIRRLWVRGAAAGPELCRRLATVDAMTRPVLLECIS